MEWMPETDKGRERGRKNGREERRKEERETKGKERKGKTSAMDQKEKTLN